MATSLCGGEGVGIAAEGLATQTSHALLGAEVDGDEG